MLTGSQEGGAQASQGLLADENFTRGRTEVSIPLGAFAALLRVAFVHDRLFDL